MGDGRDIRRLHSGDAEQWRPAPSVRADGQWFVRDARSDELAKLQALERANRIDLDAEACDRFVAVLDEPAAEMPVLHRYASQRSPIPPPYRAAIIRRVREFGGWRCVLLGSEDDFGSEAEIEIRQLDSRAAAWDASGPGGTGCGSLSEAILTAAGPRVAPGWIDAVVAALQRQINRGERDTAMRVFRGTGDWYHVTSAENRESIRQHGLDWTRMSRPGIAGSRVPEVDGVFLARDMRQVRRLMNFPIHPVVDVWVVSLQGEWLETGPNGGWGHSNMICCQTITPHRLTLAHRDSLLVHETAP